VSRAAGQTETTQENTPRCASAGFQLLKEDEIAAVIFLYLFSSALTILLNFPFICFSSFFFVF
jgi:hypothetical protein